MQSGIDHSMKLTTKDIQTTASGFYRLPCDGKHNHAYHFYLYYTKKDVIRMWKDEHKEQVTA